MLLFRESLNIRAGRGLEDCNLSVSRSVLRGTRRWLVRKGFRASRFGTGCGRRSPSFVCGTPLLNTLLKALGRLAVNKSIQCRLTQCSPIYSTSQPLFYHSQTCFWNNPFLPGSTVSVLRNSRASERRASRAGWPPGGAAPPRPSPPARVAAPARCTHGAPPSCPAWAGGAGRASGPAVLAERRDPQVWSDDSCEGAGLGPGRPVSRPWVLSIQVLGEDRRSGAAAGWRGSPSRVTARAARTRLSGLSGLPGCGRGSRQRAWGSLRWMVSVGHAGGTGGGSGREDPGEAQLGLTGAAGGGGLSAGVQAAVRERRAQGDPGPGGGGGRTPRRARARAARRGAGPAGGDSAPPPAGVARGSLGGEATQRSARETLSCQRSPGNKLEPACALAGPGRRAEREETVFRCFPGARGYSGSSAAARAESSGSSGAALSRVCKTETQLRRAWFAPRGVMT